MKKLLGYTIIILLIVFLVLFPFIVNGFWAGVIAQGVVLVVSGLIVFSLWCISE